MTKPQLVAFIMEKTTEYKKTHLVEKYKDELEAIAATFMQAAIELAKVSPADAEVCTARENAPTETTPNPAVASSAYEVILAAYEANKKSIKMRRIDKDEFKQTVLQVTAGRVATDGTTNTESITDLTISVMGELATNLIVFCPMNDNERKMLETIPLLTDYENNESEVNGKNFLQKVKELHNIEVSTSRALMVSLKRKQFITIGGGRKTFIVLSERGIKHLDKTS